MDLDCVLMGEVPDMYLRAVLVKYKIDACIFILL